MFLGKSGKKSRSFNWRTGIWVRFKGERTGWGNCWVERVPGDRIAKGDSADSVHLSKPFVCLGRAAKCHLSVWKIKGLISVSHYGSEAQNHRGL